MSAAQLHLALSHLPIVFVLVAIPILGIGIWRKSLELKNTAVAILVGAALTAIPVYLTGEPSEEIVEHRPGVSEQAIHEHEEIAEVALIAVEILGVLSLGFWLFQKFRKPLPQIYWTGLFCASLVSFGIFLQTAHLGGLVRHDEIRGPAQAGSEQMDGDSD